MALVKKNRVNLSDELVPKNWVIKNPRTEVVGGGICQGWEESSP